MIGDKQHRGLPPLFFTSGGADAPICHHEAQAFNSGIPNLISDITLYIACAFRAPHEKLSDERIQKR